MPTATHVLADGKMGRYEPSATRDRWGNRLDKCACGATKVAKWSRCKTCRAAAQVGVPKTATPGDGATHYRARKLVPEGPCSYDGCNKDGAHVHHIDGNAWNNDPSNLVRLCPRHHMTVDGRLEAAAARAREVGRRSGGRPTGVTPATDRAVAFLRAEVANGPVAATVLRARAEGAGLSWSTVSRATKRAGLRARKIGNGGWVWETAT